MSTELPLHPTYQFAKPFLDPHVDDFRYVLDHAWERWQKLPAEDRRAIAALEGGLGTAVAAYMKEAAAERFDGRRDEGIIPRDKYDPPGWSFSNRVLVRFKKMDKDGLSRNYPTRRNRQYLGNLPIPEEDLRESVRVEVGYCLNTLQTEVEQQWVVHRSGSRIVWRYPLRDTGTLVLPLVPKLPDDAEDGESFVRPRPEKRPMEREVPPIRLIRVSPEDEERRRESAAETGGKHETRST